MVMARQRQGKWCRICRSTTGPWTREDAIPRWLHKRIRAEYRALPPARILDANWAQSRRVLLKPVCQPCQRRLNHLFEVPAHQLLKEITEGSALELSPRQQVILAGWIVKTALVLGLAHMQGERVDSVNHRIYEGTRRRILRMLEDGRPPSDTTARIASVLPDGLQEPSDRPLVPAPWGDRRPFYAMNVMSFPGLACEVLVTTVATALGFVRATEDDDRFLRVWPPSVATVHWPPRVPLSLLDVAALRTQWQHPPESFGGGYSKVVYGPEDFQQDADGRAAE